MHTNQLAVDGDIMDTPQEETPKLPEEKKVPWYVMEEADNTVRLIGGLVIFIVAMIGLFIMESMNDSKTPVFLKEGIIHAIFGYVTGWISASGKKTTTTNGSGRGKP